MKKIKAVILDAGGVLVRPVHGDWNIPARYREWLGPCAGDVASPRWQDACRAEANWLREDVKMTDLEEEYRARLRFLEGVAARMRWTLTPETLAELARDFTYNPERYIWYADVDESLRHLQGRVRLGMLSDAMPSFPTFVMQRGVDRYFEQMVFSTQVGACKPDPRMYAEIVSKMNVEPGDCLFVDDKPCNLEGARDFGMAAVQMCRDGLTPSWAGDFVRDLRALTAYLEDET